METYIFFSKDGTPLATFSDQKEAEAAVKRLEEAGRKVTNEQNFYTVH